ncbi:hypothetical protein IFR05_014100 [Cadophora sp. M221]|nr:hypothetical protein IFR05_014100 [Cadophora sp. M221]
MNSDGFASTANQELPPAHEDILQTSHVKVFKPGMAGPQYDAMLSNQLTEIKQCQDTRRMLTTMLADKMSLKVAKKRSNVPASRAGVDEEDEEENLMQQLLEATKDYRKRGGSMLKRKSKNLSLAANAWKNSMLQSLKLSDENKEKLGGYEEKYLFALHIKCAKTPTTVAVDVDEDDY